MRLRRSPAFASASSPARRWAPPGAGRRLLCRQDHRLRRRRLSGRRLRHLCARGGAPSRPPHPGQSRPSWSRTCRAPAAPRPAISQPPSRPRTALTIGAVTPGAIMGPLLDDKPNALFEPTKVTYLGTAKAARASAPPITRRRSRRFDDALSNGPSSAALARRRRPTTMRYMISSARPTRSSTSSPATRARSTSRSRWSAARSTACAAGTGRA